MRGFDFSVAREHYFQAQMEQWQGVNNMIKWCPQVQQCFVLFVLKRSMKSVNKFTTNELI